MGGREGRRGAVDILVKRGGGGSVEFGVARCSFWASRLGRSMHPHTHTQATDGRNVL
jgi:hypothetical protein